MSVRVCVCACGRVGVCEGGRVCVSESERQTERRKAFKFSETFHNHGVEFELSNLLLIEDFYLSIFLEMFRHFCKILKAFFVSVVE